MRLFRDFKTKTLTPKLFGHGSCCDRSRSNYTLTLLPMTTRRPQRGNKLWSTSKKFWYQSMLDNVDGFRLNLSRVY